jgi:hypothetical protein
VLDFHHLQRRHCRRCVAVTITPSPPSWGHRHCLRFRRRRVAVVVIVAWMAHQHQLCHRRCRCPHHTPPPSHGTCHHLRRHHHRHAQAVVVAHRLPLRACHSRHHCHHHRRVGGVPQQLHEFMGFLRPRSGTARRSLRSGLSMVETHLVEGENLSP